MLLCNETEVESLECIMYDSGISFTQELVQHKTKLPQFWSVPSVPDLKCLHCRTSVQDRNPSKISVLFRLAQRGVPSISTSCRLRHIYYNICSDLLNYVSPAGSSRCHRNVYVDPDVNEACFCFLMSLGDFLFVGSRKPYRWSFSWARGHSAASGSSAAAVSSWRLFQNKLDPRWNLPS